MEVVVAEASLELIPPEIFNCPEVKKYSRKRNKRVEKLILDVSEVRGCITYLDDWKRRGRPDLVHRVLLAILDSPLNSLGRIEKVYLHTLRDRWFEIKPKTRLPRNYNRFVALMEQLLVKGGVPPKGDWLIREISEPMLKEPVIVLDPEGELVHPEFFKGFDGTIIVGGFPEGTYSREWGEHKISVAKETLTASAAICIALSWIYGVNFLK